MLRVLTSFMLASALAGALPAAAGAAGWLSFSRHGADSLVGAEPDDPYGTLGPERVDVLRNGAPIGTRLPPADWGASTRVPDLLAGDEARYYQGDTLIMSRVYDGLPTVSDACVGASRFHVKLGDLASPYVRTGPDPDSNPVTPSAAEPGLYTVARPLAAGDTIAAGGSRPDGARRVYQNAEVEVVDCPTPPPSQPAAPGPAPNSAGALVLRAYRTRTGLNVTVTYPQPGTVALRVSYHGKTLASARRAGASSERIAVKVSRRMRAHTLALSATLSPVRAGARPQTATLVLKRSR